MKMTRDYLELIGSIEQNIHADASKVNNGGGYYQPLTEYKGCYDDKPISVTIDDTSCGEFGRRYDVSVAFDGNDYCYSYDGVSREQYDDGNIPKGIAEFIHTETGYWCEPE